MKFPFVGNLVVSLLLLLSACGYRFEGGEQYHDGPVTISVPYVKGDIQGQLTTELIRQLSASGHFICQSHGELQLEVILIQQSTEKIGYRYLRENPSGKRENNLVGTENRIHIGANVALLRSSTEETLLGPSTIHAEVDFDYVDPSSIQDLAFINSEGQKQTSIQFSLGQLDSIEGAQDSAILPVYKRLAQKIVDGIIAERWD